MGTSHARLDLAHAFCTLHAAGILKVSVECIRTTEAPPTIWAFHARADWSWLVHTFGLGIRPRLGPRSGERRGYWCYVLHSGEEFEELLSVLMTDRGGLDNRGLLAHERMLVVGGQRVGKVGRPIPRCRGRT